jgi:hypothetical protein
VLKDATLFFLCATPNLATVIPAMNHIDERLTSNSINRAKFEPSIRVSLALTKKTLNRYYDLTDSSEVYRIAMVMFTETYHLILYSFFIIPHCNLVLHPRHKLSYFRQAGWPTEWIRTAEDIVHTEFKRSYVIDIEEVREHGEAGNSEDDGIMVSFLCIISYLYYSLILL